MKSVSHPFPHMSPQVYALIECHVVTIRHLATALKESHADARARQAG